MFWNGKNRNKYYNFSSQFSIFEKFKIYKEKVASGHSSVCVYYMYVHAPMREICFRPVVAYLKISPSLILFQMEGERYRKKCSKINGRKKKNAQDSSVQQRVGRMPHFPMGI